MSVCNCSCVQWRSVGDLSTMPLPICKSGQRLEVYCILKGKRTRSQILPPTSPLTFPSSYSSLPPSLTLHLFPSSLIPFHCFLLPSFFIPSARLPPTTVPPLLPLACHHFLLPSFPSTFPSLLPSVRSPSVRLPSLLSPFLFLLPLSSTLSITPAPCCGPLPSTPSPSKPPSTGVLIFTSTH